MCENTGGVFQTNPSGSVSLVCEDDPGDTRCKSLNTWKFCWWLGSVPDDEAEIQSPVPSASGVTRGYTKAGRRGGPGTPAEFAMNRSIRLTSPRPE